MFSPESSAVECGAAAGKVAGKERLTGEIEAALVGAGTGRLPV
jgi:hypothetical protein